MVGVIAQGGVMKKHLGVLICAGGLIGALGLLADDWPQ